MSKAISVFKRPLFIYSIAKKDIFLHQRCFCSKNTSNEDSKNTTSGGNEKSENKPQEKKLIANSKQISEGSKEAAKKKLLSLLSELEVVPDTESRISPTLNLAKAVKRPSKKERFKDIIEQQNKSPDEPIRSAAEEVASSISGDTARTLAELNEKLGSLNLLSRTKEVVETQTETAPDSAIIEDDGTKTIMSSVEDVASIVFDDSAPAKSVLTQRLLKLSAEKDPSTLPKKSIDELMKGMTIDRSGPKQRPKLKDLDVIKRSEGYTQQQSGPASFSIFDAPPLEIFPKSGEYIPDSKLSVWQKLEEKKMRLMVQFAPTNAFEEMIMWTEQGRHWKFPIDNQTEMGAEENVGFHEHVFLEQHLHGFPRKGPVRHFMELVCVGLSKNPHVTVDRKIENINWFRDYFKGKEDILHQAGVLDSGIEEAKKT